MDDLPRVSNVVLYINDAIRYDAACDRLAEMGRTHKTVSASVHTAPSITSILTGAYVPNHGVTSFKREVQDYQTTIGDLQPRLRIADHDHGRAATQCAVPDISRRAIEDAEEPFIWIGHSPGGHAPYGQHNYDKYWSETTAPEYFAEVGADFEKMRTDYQRGVDDSIAELVRIQSVLQSRGIEDETLIVHVSDHGELFGEYGFVGHNYLTVPELVYTPTAFIHPDVPAGHDERLISHTDILPTIAYALGEDLRVPDGRALQSGNPREMAHVYFKKEFYSDTGTINANFGVQAIYGHKGGYVESLHSRLDGLKMAAGLLLKSPKRTAIRHSGKQIQLFRTFIQSQNVYGELPAKVDELRDELGDIGHNDNGADKSEVNEEQLKDLGYL
ncbi:sulfatase-like hydrolase/transferase [Haloarcula amylovorans]|uniref:sulfatase-like hydrolase/transferase n=1 Tax=Haloarcula amylovorans TaxID=2562280 RepID=UPI0010763737|nr:sulfatase-like hydrolase/transferase [Halomicroarcula amylolytica]